MKLNFKKTKLVDIDKVVIPDRFYNRHLTGVTALDHAFGGEGILPGSTFTLSARPGCGKCHAPDQVIEVHGSSEVIEHIFGKYINGKRYSIIVTFKQLFDALNVGIQDNEVEFTDTQLFVKTPTDELAPIRGYIRKTDHRIIEMKLSNGEVLKVADRHLLFQDGDCMFAEDCNYVDTVDGTFQVKSVIEDSIGDVYDISIDAPHVYVTPNGVIHHNTTLLLQLLNAFGRPESPKGGQRVGYVSGEECIEQIAFTCERINVTNVKVANETDVYEIIELIKKYELEFLIIDSFQGLRIDYERHGMERLKGKNQESHICNELVNAAQELNCVIGIILHVTKSGEYKGGTDLPHAVDANYQLSPHPEDDFIRVLSGTKNRFGSVQETEFMMTSAGFDLNSDVKAMQAEANKQENLYKLDMISENEGDIIDTRRFTELGDGSYPAGQKIIRDMMAAKLIKQNGRGKYERLIPADGIDEGTESFNIDELVMD